MPQRRRPRPELDLEDRGLRLPRRGFLLGATAAVALGTFYIARWYGFGGDLGAEHLTAPEALELVQAGQITLIDIRRPDEWARTGLPQGAVALDMRRADFGSALLAALEGDRSAPVALICARGVRSARLGAALRKAGFENLMEVPEGMLGSGAGPGWVKRGLPVTAP